MQEAQSQSLVEVQKVTSEYASYSQSKNGLGNLLGGVVVLIVYLLNALLGHGWLTTLLTIVLTIGWLVGKEVIRQRLYRRFGMAQERWPEKMRRSHLLSAIFTTICIAFVWGVFLLKLYLSPWMWLFALLSVVLTPWIGWRYLRGTNEFVVGTFLLIACIVVSAGGVFQPTSLEGWGGTLLFPLTGLIMIIGGFNEHRAFQKLAARLQSQFDKERLYE